MTCCRVAATLVCRLCKAGSCRRAAGAQVGGRGAQSICRMSLQAVWAAHGGPHCSITSLYTSVTCHLATQQGCSWPRAFTRAQASPGRPVTQLLLGLRQLHLALSPAGITSNTFGLPPLSLCITSFLQHLFNVKLLDYIYF